MGMEKGSGLNFAAGGSGGGGGSSPTPPAQQGEYFVKVIDYDGTVIDEQWLDDGAEYTLPANPDRTDKGLEFQEWSCSQDIVNGKVTIDKNNVMIGATYTTVSGANEIDIELNANTGLSVTLTVYGGTKDWGDGTTDTNTSHTYSNYGKYTIKFTGTNLSASSGNGGIFGQKSYAINQYVIAVRLATVQSVKNYSFQYCFSLKYVSFSNTVSSIDSSSFSACEILQSVVIPNKITTIGSGAFAGGYNLKQIVFSKGIVSIGANAFNNCHNLSMVAIPTTMTTIAGFSNCENLEKIILPNSITTIGSSCFSACYSLKEITIQNSVTSIGSSSFQNCFSLDKIKIPNSVTTIDTQAFYNNINIKEYDFSDFTSVPTLNDTSAFTQINAFCKIKVPSALYDQWITETNWVTYADYIVAV